MNKKTPPELDQLFYDVGAYRKSAEFKKLLEFVNRFPNIAPYNAMLMHIQKPGSRYVASASEWESRFGRSVSPGARPLVILRPFGPVAFLFELGDTDGRPFPEDLMNPFKVEGEISDSHFNTLVNNLKCDGISFNEADHGISSGGFAQINQSRREQTIVRNKKEFQVRVLYDMVVNRNHSKEIKFTTILHELGPIYCGHLGTPHPQWWDDRRGLGRNVEEFEAESICWMVCGRLGINNPSAEYLSGYLDSKGEIPYISIDSVLKATGAIESMIRGSKEPRKEIILSINDVADLRQANLFKI
jgi:hypothetical protein